MKNISVHTDGAARGNPGPASIAFVISNDGELTEFYEAIGETTNNQAEYRAMLAACQELHRTSPSDSTVVFNSDSELMIKQLKGEYRVKDANIRPHYEGITAVLSSLKAAGNQIVLNAVRRESNKRADELANLALDA